LALHFDHGEFVAIDREDESWVARDRHQAESVTCALLNVHDSKRDILRTTRVAAFAVDQSGIECRDAWGLRRQVVVPICEGDDGTVVVNIVQVSLRIIWIFNNKSPSQAIAVLVPKMTMIPIRARLVRDLKVVFEGFIGYKRTLRDKSWAIIIIGMLLEETMPVDGGGQVQGVILESIDDIDAKSASLLSPDYWGRKDTIGEGSYAGVPIRGDHFVDDLKLIDDGPDRGRNAGKESSKEANRGAKPRHREWEYQRRREQ
jgi:hypothetical protein